jgi:hypothetical protein
VSKSQLEGLAGSFVLPSVPEAQIEVLRGALKQRINLAWSSEALKSGVGAAKAGEPVMGHSGGTWDFN